MNEINSNTAEQAMLGGFSKAVDDAVLDSGEAHNNKMMQLLSDPERAKVFFELLSAAKSD
jgi:type I restriction enzyme R subunit